MPVFKAEPGKRKYHRAKLISEAGVSPLCAKKPRAIDVSPSSKETWTLDDSAVTCPACRRLINQSAARPTDGAPTPETGGAR